MVETGLEHVLAGDAVTSIDELDGVPELSSSSQLLAMLNRRARNSPLGSHDALASIAPRSLHTEGKFAVGVSIVSAYQSCQLGW